MTLTAKYYFNTVTEAKEALGIKKFFMIAHGPSFPAWPGQDIGIGSPFSKGAEVFLADLKALGFDGVQLGPPGKTKKFDPSPYMGTMFSSNPLFVDLAKLTLPEYGELLSHERFQALVKQHANRAEAGDRVAYAEAYDTVTQALQEAYLNFKSADHRVGALAAELEAFKKKYQEWLEKDALYEALSMEHQNDYWPNWPSSLDQNLYKEDPSLAADQVRRIAELKSKYYREIELYFFTQFILSKQIKEINAFMVKIGMSYIADRQVAFSDSDIWANQSLFLPGYFLGCPPEPAIPSGQLWGFPILDPRKIVDKDGNLLAGGQLIKAVFEKMFDENQGGVRVDHAIGLIDPWVYPRGKGGSPADGAGRLFSSPENEGLSPFRIAETGNVNFDLPPDHRSRVRLDSLSPEQISAYGRVIKIIVDAADARGIDHDALICEDLGAYTDIVQAVLNHYGLSRSRMIMLVDPSDGHDINHHHNYFPDHWVSPTTHDHKPVQQWFLDWPESQVARFLHYLSETVKPSHPEEFPTSNDEMGFVKAVLTEAFVTPAEHIQFFFTDAFGINVRYNTPGTFSPNNWVLRLPENYMALYLKTLTKGYPNLPEVLIWALQSKELSHLPEHTGLCERLTELSQRLKHGTFSPVARQEEAAKIPVA